MDQLELHDTMRWLLFILVLNYGFICLLPSPPTSPPLFLLCLGAIDLGRCPALLLPLETQLGQVLGHIFF